MPVCVCVCPLQEPVSGCHRRMSPERRQSARLCHCRWLDQLFAPLSYVLPPSLHNLPPPPHCDRAPGGSKFLSTHAAVVVCVRLFDRAARLQTTSLWIVGTFAFVLTDKRQEDSESQGCGWSNPVRQTIKVKWDGLGLCCLAVPWFGLLA